MEKTFGTEIYRVLSIIFYRHLLPLGNAKVARRGIYGSRQIVLSLLE